jgi:hypothetical protein
MAVNAKDDTAAYSAFRRARNDTKDKLGGSLTIGLRLKHPAIAADLGSDAGIELMNEDSRITEHVIKRFTERGLPVLTVHDSYIVHFSYHDLVQEMLEEALAMVPGMTGIRSDRTGVAWGDETSWQSQRLEQEAVTRSERYIQRLLRWMVNGKNMR